MHSTHSDTGIHKMSHGSQVTMAKVPCVIPVPRMAIFTMIVSFSSVQRMQRILVAHLILCQNAFQLNIILFYWFILLFGGVVLIRCWTATGETQDQIHFQQRNLTG